MRLELLLFRIIGVCLIIWESLSNIKELKRAKINHLYMVANNLNIIDNRAPPTLAEAREYSNQSGVPHQEGSQ